MPPREPEQPRPRPVSTGALLGAAATGTVAGSAQAPPPPPVGAGLGAGATAAEVAAAVGQAINALREGGQASGGDEGAWLWIVNAIRPSFPEEPEEVLRAAAETEAEREEEFLRRMRARLQRDVPTALAADDPQEALDRLLARERRFMDMHQQAAATRVEAAVRRDMVKRLSPEGAFWRMSPLVKEHTPDCIALAARGWWPWEVLDRLHPPMHPGCRCELLTHREAMALGLMGPALPDNRDAIARAEQIIADFGLLQEAYWASEGAKSAPEAGVLETAVINRGNQDGAKSGQNGHLVRDSQGGARLLEAAETHTGAMVALFPDPETATRLAIDGGEPPEQLHVTLAYLGNALKLGDPEPALRAVQHWAAECPPLRGEISGVGTFRSGPTPVTYLSVDLPELPEQRERLVKALDDAGVPPSRDHGFTPHMTLDYASRRPRIDGAIPITFERVTVAWADDHYSFRLGRDLQEGVDALDLEELHWNRRYPEGTIWGGRFMPKRGGFAPRVSLGDILKRLLGSDAPRLTPRGGQRSPATVTAPAATPSRPTARRSGPRRAGTPPATFQEFADDILQAAHRLAEDLGADVQLGELAIDPEFADTQGWRTFDGDVRIGPHAQVYVEEAARRIQNGERVPDDVSAGVYHAYRTAVHEILHGINPQEAGDYKGAGRALEEALTEEMAHDLVTEQLRRAGHFDVLRWRARKPDDMRAKGVYLPQRAGLAALLDEAKVPVEKRREFLRQLKFGLNPKMREQVLAGLVSRANEGVSLTEARKRVRGLMEAVDEIDPLGKGATVLEPQNPVDRRMRVHTGQRVSVGDGRYEGVVTDAGYAPDGEWHVEVEVDLGDGEKTWRYPDPREVEVIKEAPRPYLKGDSVEGTVREGDMVQIVQANGQVAEGELLNIGEPDALGWKAQMQIGTETVVIRPSSVQSVKRAPKRKPEGSASVSNVETDQPAPPETPTETWRRSVIERVAAAAHESWREQRNFEPRVKTDDEGNEVDLAATPYAELPHEFRRENAAGAESAVGAIERMRREQGTLDIEALAAEVHDEWVKRNPDAPKAQRKPYADLPESDKEKDRFFVRAALEAMGIAEPEQGPDELLDVEGPTSFDARRYQNPRRALITKVRALPRGGTLELADGSRIIRGMRGDSAAIERPDGSRRRYATVNRLTNAEMQGIGTRHGLSMQGPHRADDAVALEQLSPGLPDGMGDTPNTPFTDAERTELNRVREGGQASPATLRKITDTLGIDPFDVDLDKLDDHAEEHRRTPRTRLREGSPCARRRDIDFAVHRVLPAMLQDRYPRVAAWLARTSPRWGSAHWGEGRHLPLPEPLNRPGMVGRAGGRGMASPAHVVSGGYTPGSDHDALVTRAIKAWVDGEEDIAHRVRRDSMWPGWEEALEKAGDPKPLAEHRLGALVAYVDVNGDAYDRIAIVTGPSSLRILPVGVEGEARDIDHVAERARFAELPLEDDDRVAAALEWEIKNNPDITDRPLYRGVPPEADAEPGEQWAADLRGWTEEPHIAHDFADSESGTGEIWMLPPGARGINLRARGQGSWDPAQEEVVDYDREWIVFDPDAVPEQLLAQGQSSPSLEEPDPELHADDFDGIVRGPADGMASPALNDPDEIKAKLAEHPAGLEVVGVSDQEVCELCGRQNLKRTIELRDKESGDIVRYGTDCAALAVGYGKGGAGKDKINKAAALAVAEVEAQAERDRRAALPDTPATTWLKTKADDLVRDSLKNYIYNDSLDAELKRRYAPMKERTGRYPWEPKGQASPGDVPFAPRDDLHPQEEAAVDRGYSPDEARAIRMYLNGANRVINERLESDDLSDMDRRIVGGLESAIARSDAAPETLYRAVVLDGMSPEQRARYAEVQVGDRWREPRFISATKDENIAQNFTATGTEVKERALIVFEALDYRTRGLDFERVMPENGYAQVEREVLLPRDGEITVTEVEDTPDGRRIYVTFDPPPTRPEYEPTGQASPALKPERSELADSVLGGFHDTRAKWAVWEGGEWRYDPERRELHEEIIEAFLADKEPPTGRKPELVFTAGGPGAGKSSITESGVTEMPADAVEVNSDLVKERLPEFRQLAEARDPYSGPGVHEESSQVAKEIYRRARERGLDIVFDGVGGGTTFPERLREAARDDRYDVRVVIAVLPTEEGIARARARAERSGRTVPEDVIRMKYRQVPQRFAEYEREPDLAIEVYDTDVDFGEPARLVASKQRGDDALSELDPEVLHAFRASATISSDEGDTEQLDPDAPGGADRGARSPGAEVRDRGPGPRGEQARRGGPEGQARSAQGQLSPPIPGQGLLSFAKKLDKGAKPTPSTPRERRELDRSEIEAPPAPVQGIPSYRDVELKDVKAAGGSNGARFAEDPEGRRWLVKTYRGNRDRVATELLANAVYRELGVTVPNAGHTVVDVPQHGETQALTYPLVDGVERPWSRPNEALAEGFVADALLANWDVVGLSYDNVLWNGDTPIRLDQGGTLEFRAMGKPKPYGPIPTELWTMNKPGGQAYGRMAITEEGLKAAARDAELRLTPERIDDLVDAAPFEDDAMRERVRENMKARVEWLGRFSRGEEGLPEPLEGAEIVAEFRERDAELETYPEEDAALQHYLTPEGRQEIDAHLHSGKPKDAASVETQGTIEQMDGLLGDKVTRTTEDFIAWLEAPESMKPGKALEKLVGQWFGDKSYLNPQTEFAPTPGRVAIRILVPEGSNALLPSALDSVRDPTPGRVILPRGTRLQITAVREIDGLAVLDAVASTRR